MNDENKVKIDIGTENEPQEDTAEPESSNTPDVEEPALAAGTATCSA